jgi:hypothetical protein
MTDGTRNRLVEEVQEVLEEEYMNEISYESDESEEEQEVQNLPDFSSRIIREIRAVDL